MQHYCVGNMVERHRRRTISGANMVKISIPENKKYVLVQVEGAMTRDIAKQMARSAKNVRVENHLDQKYLIDVRKAPNINTVFQDFFFANEDLAEIDADKRAWLALLVSPDDDTYDFLEMAICNAGYGNVRLFTHEDDAVAWLDR